MKSRYVQIYILGRFGKMCLRNLGLATAIQTAPFGLAMTRRSARQLSSPPIQRAMATTAQATASLPALRQRCDEFDAAAVPELQAFDISKRGAKQRRTQLLQQHATHFEFLARFATQTLGLLPEEASTLTREDQAARMLRCAADAIRQIIMFQAFASPAPEKLCYNLAVRCSVLEVDAAADELSLLLVSTLRKRVRKAPARITSSVQEATFVSEAADGADMELHPLGACRGEGRICAIATARAAVAVAVSKPLQDTVFSNVGSVILFSQIPSGQPAVAVLAQANAMCIHLRIACKAASAIRGSGADSVAAQGNAILERQLPDAHACIETDSPFADRVSFDEQTARCAASGIARRPELGAAATIEGFGAERKFLAPRLGARAQGARVRQVRPTKPVSPFVDGTGSTPVVAVDDPPLPPLFDLFSG
eukprot:3720666-Pleurochrysis_carterae.AAC.4